MKMKKPRNIYKSFLIVLVSCLLLWSCKAPREGEEEKTPVTPAEITDNRGYDPLELPQDKDIIPEKYPKTGAITGSKMLSQVTVSESDTVDLNIAEAPVSSDTLNNQVFRVQLFTSKYYFEARKALAVAEEIFDQAVYLDYEVPYFKIRVGNFRNREDAELYQQKTREAGYGSAWVVVVNLGVKEPAALYENLPGLMIEKDTASEVEDSLPEGEEPNTDD